MTGTAPPRGRLTAQVIGPVAAARPDPERPYWPAVITQARSVPRPSVQATTAGSSVRTTSCTAPPNRSLDPTSGTASSPSKSLNGSSNTIGSVTPAPTPRTAASLV